MCGWIRGIVRHEFLNPGIEIPIVQGHADGFERLGAEVASFDSGLVFLEVMVFVALLAAGFVYAWRRGVFQWR